MILHIAWLSPPAFTVVASAAVVTVLVVVIIVRANGQEGRRRSSRQWFGVTCLSRLVKRMVSRL